MRRSRQRILRSHRPLECSVLQTFRVGFGAGLLSPFGRGAVERSKRAASAIGSRALCAEWLSFPRATEGALGFLYRKGKRKPRRSDPSELCRLCRGILL